MGTEKHCTRPQRALAESPGYVCEEAQTSSFGVSAPRHTWGEAAVGADGPRTRLGEGGRFWDERREEREACGRADPVATRWRWGGGGATGLHKRLQLILKRSRRFCSSFPDRMLGPNPDAFLTQKTAAARSLGGEEPLGDPGTVVASDPVRTPHTSHGRRDKGQPEPGSISSTRTGRWRAGDTSISCSDADEAAGMAFRRWGWPCAPWSSGRQTPRHSTGSRWPQPLSL